MNKDITKGMVAVTAGLWGMAMFATIFVPAFFMLRSRNEYGDLIMVWLGACGLLIGLPIFLKGLELIFMRKPQKEAQKVIE